MSSYLIILNATLEKVFDLEPGLKVFQEKALDEIVLLCLALTTCLEKNAISR